MSLPYVLVADADRQRAAVCIEAVSSHSTGVLIAHNRDEALRVLNSFGAPRALIVDLLLPGGDGFSVIEAMRRVEQERGGVLAWSSARPLREFAASRLAGMDVRVLNGSVNRAVIRTAIDHLLVPRQANPGEPLDRLRSSSPETIHDTMAELAEKARQICHTAGVAVYFRSGADQLFRASATWLPDEPPPRSLDALPVALNKILQTGEAYIAQDMAVERPEGLSYSGPDELRGLIAVPIGGNIPGEVAGMLAVFDVKPLTLANSEIAALKALGHPPAPPRPTPFVPIRVPTAATERPFERAGEAVASEPESPVQPLLDREVGAFAVSRELARARREQRRLSVVVLDVAPERAGEHEDAGSGSALESAGHSVARVIRGYDFAIRWSGQELLVVLPGIGEREANRVADRVRAAIRAAAGPRLSIGGMVAELRDDATLASVVSKAAAVRQ